MTQFELWIRREDIGSERRWCAHQLDVRFVDGASQIAELDPKFRLTIDKVFGEDRPEPRLNSALVSKVNEFSDASPLAPPTKNLSWNEKTELGDFSKPLFREMTDILPTRSNLSNFKSVSSEYQTQSSGFAHKDASWLQLITQAKLELIYNNETITHR